MTRSPGVTLVELMVVLVLLGVMAGLVGLAWSPRTWTGPEGEDVTSARTLRAARARAMTAGVPVMVTATSGDRSDTVLALPDGRLVGAARFGVDPFSGLPADSAGAEAGSR